MANFRQQGLRSALQSPLPTGHGEKRGGLPITRVLGTARTTARVLLQDPNCRAWNKWCQHISHLPTHSAPILNDQVGNAAVGRNPPRLVPSDAETEYSDLEELVRLVPDSIQPDPIVVPSDAETVESDEKDGAEFFPSEFNPSRNRVDAIFLDRCMLRGPIDNNYIEQLRAAARSNNNDIVGEVAPVQRANSEHMPADGFGNYVGGIGTPPLSPQTEDLESLEPTSSHSIQGESNSEEEAPFGNKTLHKNRHVGYGVLDTNTQCPQLSAANIESQLTINLSDDGEPECLEHTDNENEDEPSWLMEPTSSSRRTGPAEYRKSEVPTQTTRTVDHGGRPSNNVLRERQQSNVVIGSTRRTTMLPTTTGGNVPTGASLRTMISAGNCRATTTPGSKRGKENEININAAKPPPNSSMRTGSQRTTIQPGRVSQNNMATGSQRRSVPSPPPWKTGLPTAPPKAATVHRGMHETGSTPTSATRQALPKERQGIRVPPSKPGKGYPARQPVKNRGVAAKESTNVPRRHEEPTKTPALLNVTVGTTRRSGLATARTSQRVPTIHESQKTKGNGGSTPACTNRGSNPSIRREVHNPATPNRQHVSHPTMIPTPSTKEGPLSSKKDPKKTSRPYQAPYVPHGVVIDDNAQAGHQESQSPLEHPLGSPQGLQAHRRGHEPATTNQAANAVSSRNANLTPAERARRKERSKLRKREQRARKKEEAALGPVASGSNSAIATKTKPELKLFQGEPSGSYQQATLMTKLSKIVPTVIPCFRPVRNITLEELEKIHCMLKSKYANGNQLVPTWTRRSVSRLVQSRRTRTRRKVECYVKALSTRRRHAKAPDVPVGVFASELDFFMKQIGSEEFKLKQKQMQQMSRDMVRNRGCGNPHGAGGLERARAHHTLEAGVPPTIAQVREWKDKALARYEAGSSRTATARRAQGVVLPLVQIVNTELEGHETEDVQIRATEDEIVDEVTKDEDSVEDDEVEETSAEADYAGKELAKEDSAEEASSNADEEKEERARVLAERAIAIGDMGPDWFDPFLGPALFFKRFMFLYGKKPTARDLKAWVDAGQPLLH